MSESSGESSNAPMNGGPGADWSQLLGLKVLRQSAELVEVEWEVQARHLQPWGIVHGGVYCSVVETTCSVGAQLGAPEGTHVVGVENHTSFLRSVASGLLTARAKPLHAGRKSPLWQCEIVDAQDRLVATGRLRLMCVRSEASAQQEASK